MPSIQVFTNAAVPDQTRLDTLSRLSKLVAETIGKPEQYVLAAITPGQMIMAGKPGLAAFVEVRSIGGLQGGVNGQLSKKICDCLRQNLQIPPERIYLNFQEVDAVNWGWNSDTFG